jgi:threonylcarbamoyladenosine tRNA methylthiotransferase MtaB
MYVKIETFGCKVNQYESQYISEQCERSGFVITNNLDCADVLIVNSCTVTSLSDQKARKMLRKAKKINPDIVLVVTGCMPQSVTNEEISKLEANIIMGNSNRLNIVKNIFKFLESKENIIDIKPHKKDAEFESMNITSFENRTRAFVKIEDGCENYCSYCRIPFARGRVRSKNLGEVIKEVTKLSQGGYKEIVLTGINLSAYGKDLGIELIDAIKAICKIEGIKRVRLSSLECDYLTDQVILELSKQNKLCPHFHLSLQSGCDETLMRMNRHYDTKKYYHIVNKIRENFKNPSFTTDVLVGFPGETDEEFTKSLNFVKKVGFFKVHVFPYSKREGTKAALYEHQIKKDIKKQRVGIMLKASQDLTSSFLKNQTEKVLSVLFETKRGNYFEGLSENYTHVKVESKEDIRGKIYNVKITQVYKDYCAGELI